MQALALLNSHWKLQNSLFFLIYAVVSGQDSRGQAAQPFFADDDLPMPSRGVLS